MQSSFKKTAAVVSASGNTLKKTKPCCHFMKHGVCNLGDNCGFAHSVDELCHAICRHDMKCWNDNCLFIHSDETVSEFRERIQFVAPKFPSPVKKEKVIHNKTQACKHILENGKCPIENCNFAHYIEELSDPECKYGKKCFHPDTCIFKHPFENSKEFRKRIKFVTPKLPSKTNVSSDKDVSFVTPPIPIKKTPEFPQKIKSKVQRKYSELFCNISKSKNQQLEENSEAKTNLDIPIFNIKVNNKNQIIPLVSSIVLNNSKFHLSIIIGPKIESGNKFKLEFKSLTQESSELCNFVTEIIENNNNIEIIVN